jgi:pimeloyl-ACP methyl ester carboxylesterase
MSIKDSHVATEAHSVHANGIDIDYLERGEGEPLVLLHGGMVSTNSIWAGVPVAYASYMDTLAEHFRVIATDTPGCGKTVHTDGPVTFELLADDVAALIEALRLERPLITGFSDGAITATVVGIRHPNAVRAIVNHAGFDEFDPQAPTFAMMRQLLGGSPEATDPNPDAAARLFEGSDEMRPMFERMKQDQDSSQGEGHWRTYLRLSWDRTTQHPGHTYADFAKITAPTLILSGDRDNFCSVEQAVEAYRQLPNGELQCCPATAITSRRPRFRRRSSSSSASSPAETNNARHDQKDERNVDHPRDRRDHAISRARARSRPRLLRSAPGDLPGRLDQVPRDSRVGSEFGRRDRGHPGRHRRELGALPLRLVGAQLREGDSHRLERLPARQ